MLQFGARVVDAELPVDPGLFAIALLGPGRRFRRDQSPALDPAIQALAVQRTELQFRNVYCGYRCFSLVRASSMLSCQSTPVCSRLRSSAQAAVSDVTKALLSIRRSRHWRCNALNSSSATFSQLPCFGVCTQWMRSFNRLASAAGNAADSPVRALASPNPTSCAVW